MKLSVVTPSIRPHYLDITQKCLELQTYSNFEWLVEVGLRRNGFTLPKDWNKLIRRASGDIVVILQDCIAIPHDALERIAALPHDRMAYTYPVGKTQGDGNVQWDWRKVKEDATGPELTANLWEIDYASAPTSMFFEVGGFDEDFCNGWSWENVEIAWRAFYAGYKFCVSRVTEGVALDHDAKAPHPFRNKLENNDQRANETRKRAERGDFRLSFLS